jgi:hypothetical protein
VTQLAGLRRRSRNSAAAAFGFREADDRRFGDQDRGERPQLMPWPSAAYGAVRTSVEHHRRRRLAIDVSPSV